MKNVVLVMSVLCASFGCATFKGKVSKNCLSGEIPERKKITILNDPRAVEMSTDDGQTVEGMEVVVDPDSLVDFTKYVEKLEKMAKWSKDRCYLRD